jgi:hypothetical protein
LILDINFRGFLNIGKLNTNVRFYLNKSMN